MLTGGSAAQLPREPAEGHRIVRQVVRLPDAFSEACSAPFSAVIVEISGACNFFPSGPTGEGPLGAPSAVALPRTRYLYGNRGSWEHE